MEIKLTNRGEYISEKDSKFIREHDLKYLSSYEFEKYGCLQEYALNEVCIGYNQQEKKWYGWVIRNDLWKSSSNRKEVLAWLEWNL